MANEFIARNGVIAQNDSQVTGSLIVTNGITGSLFGTSSWAVNAITANTASYILNATSASFAATGSYADNFTVKNTLTAQTLVVSVVSSSVVYSSGSNIFGNSLTDTQKFTGSVQITGSLSVNGTTATLGTGTINTVPKFTAVNTIGNSNITDNGTLITLNTGSYVNGNLSIGTATIPFGEKLFIQGDASAASAVLTTSANSGISTLSVNVDRGLQGGVNIIADKTNQLGIIRVNNSDFWPLVFQVRGADGVVERMRITNIGSVGIGATSLTGYNLRVSKNITGAISSSGIQSDGVIQSDVTTSTSYNATLASTAATTFTIGTITHYIANQGTFGAGSTVTNQWGFHASSNLIGATNNYGFRGAIPSGTNRWNLYMDGTANNYMAGALGIGTTALTGRTLYLAKTLTGSTNSTGLYQDGVIQSDVTANARYFDTYAQVQNTAFTLSNLYHYRAGAATFTGATVTTQIGFLADATLNGATNNYGYWGGLNAAANTWNFYASGTANNYLAGSLGIGSTSFTSGGGTYNLRVAKAISGSVVAGGVTIDGTIQSDVTSAGVGLNVQVSTAASSFTLSQLRHISVNEGTIGAGSVVNNQYGIYVDQITKGTSNYAFFGNTPVSGSRNWNIYMDGSAPNFMAGNLGIGTTSLTGYELRVGANITGATTSYGIAVDGTIQSDVTSTALIYTSRPATAAASFNLGTLGHYYVTQGTLGAGSTIGTQVGFWVSSGLTNATTNYAFYSLLAAGTGRWNLYMEGTANNYMAGALGIGSTSVGNGINLNMAKTMTGATTQWNIYNQSQVQSDVTSLADYFRTNASTQAASFTLNNLVHYRSAQGTFGAGSTVNTQYGFLVEASLVGATTNYGFAGLIPSGSANNWNLYMLGTAPNYMAGSLGIGSTSLSNINLRIGKNISGSTDAYGLLIDSSIVSGVTANAYVFRSLPATVAASFTLTNLYHFSARENTIGAGSAITNQYGFAVESNLTSATNNYGFYGNIASGTNRWNLYMAGTATNYLAGRLGIGVTAPTSTNVALNLNITGGGGSNGFYQLGVVQSDVTSTAYGYRNLSATQAASFTLPDYFHFAALQGSFGAGSTVTNQYGFHVDSSLTGATNDFGFYGNLGASANVWNLYMNGTANNYMAGALGIGSTSLTGYNFRMAKNITGATVSINAGIEGQIQSDVTSQAFGVRVGLSTAATAFSVTDLFNFRATNATIGAGSSIGIQYGFAVADLTSGGANYAFESRVSAGTNKYGLYFSGDATNYLAGALGIGSTGLTNINLAMSKNISGSVTSYGIYSNGTIQSGVTTAALYNAVFINTAAASFTVNAAYAYYAAGSTIGAGSAISQQHGFYVHSSLVGATVNYAYRSTLASSGSANWNVYMDGTADNYLAGALGIGSTSLTEYSLRIAKNITGSTVSYAIRQDGTVQSDVTSTAYGVSNSLRTANATFTLPIYYHYFANAAALGTNSAVTNQYAYFADASLTGATNNYGFYGNIASATGRWNLYMAGTAANYLAGDTSIGTTTGGYKLNVNGTIFSSKVTNNAAISNSPADASLLLYAPTTTNYYGGIIGWAEGNIAASISSYDDGLGGALGLSIATGNNTSISERVRISSTGFVGINKTNPSASLDVSGSVLITGSLDVTNGITGSLFGTASYATSASYAATSSYADNFTVANQLTATTLVVQTVSSSVVYSSGSNVFGNSLSNTQQFTGSVTITGSLGVNTTSTTRTLTVNGSILAGGVTTYEKRYSSVDTTGVAVAGLSAGLNGDSAVFTFTCYGGLGYQRIVYSCRNESTTWRTSKTIDEGANALDVLASVDGATITFTFRGRSATQQFRPSVIVEASGNSIDTTYL